MLTKEQTNERQKKLIACLENMATECLEDFQVDNFPINDKIKEFKAIYSDGFRHNYSSFFSLISKIAKNDNQYNLDFLSNNLEAVRNVVENDRLLGKEIDEELYRSLIKLIDHINLEIARYSYTEQTILDLKASNKKLQSSVRETKHKLEIIKDEYKKEVEEKISSVQIQIITVLSIFAAIVLTFSGSISFSGNVLRGMAETPALKAVALIILCGLITFNTIFLLIYMIGKITDKDIYARCKTTDCTCGDDGQPECSGLKQIRKRLPYVFWFNAILLAFLFIDILVWICHSTA